MAQPRQFYTPQEFSLLTGLSYSLVLAELRAGEIPACYVKLPRRRVGRWKIAIRDAHAYCAKIGLGAMCNPQNPQNPQN